MTETPQHDWYKNAAPQAVNFEFIRRVGSLDLYKDRRDADYLIRGPIPGVIITYAYLNFVWADETQTSVVPACACLHALAPYDVCMLYEYASVVPRNRVVEYSVYTF